VADEPAPFIVTLTLDGPSQTRFDTLRSAHFPAERLLVGAHVTLFHALPHDLNVARAVNAETAQHAPFPVQVTGLRFLGRGVAFSLESAPLRAIRDSLRRLWAVRLTAQDRQAWQPHVTIQNKVEPAVAWALHDRLSDGFTPFLVTATGLAVWIYRNGPWEAVDRWPFSA
jgi:2'-5' RNA ligase